MSEILAQLYSTREVYPAPILPPMGHVVLLLSLVFLYTVAKRGQGERLAKWSLGFLLVVLYQYFLFVHFSWKLSLPMYHCRIAMFLMLILPDGSKWKQYIAYLGVLGPFIAFLYPVLPNYSIFHVTTICFILMHQLLFFLSCLYLFKQEPLMILTSREIQVDSILLTIAIAISSWLTGGNYGFLQELPVLHSHNFLLNTVLMTFLLGGVIFLVQRIFLSVEQKREVAW